jgi:hypothetical protein
MKNSLKLLLGFSVALLATTSAALAQSDDDNCKTNLLMYGISVRGSAVCNRDWLDRPSSKKILENAQAGDVRLDAKALRSSACSSSRPI